MGDPTPSYAAPMSAFLRPPPWTGYCLRCGRLVYRRWWQRGILTPLPLCRRVPGRPDGCR